MSVISRKMAIIIKLTWVNMNTVVSLFSGCGGLDYGFELAGFKTIWANELSEDACKSFEALVGTAPQQGDIRDLLGTIPKATVLIGGPPCQSFSLVGKRDKNDPRGQLVFSFLDAVRKVSPKAFVMENVPGLLASRIDDKPLSEILVKEFENLGYTVAILKLNAVEYFVPQRRKRVFIVGHKNPKKNFAMISSQEFAKRIGFSRQIIPVTSSQALADLPKVSAKGSFHSRAYKGSPHNDFAKYLRRKKLSTTTLHSMPTMSARDLQFVKYIPPGGNYASIPDEIATGRIKRIKEQGGRTTTYGRLHQDSPAYTINTYFNRPNVGANYHYLEDRLISVREALRLQSFPDDFTPFFTNQRSLHQQIGNAVPPLLARAVAETLREFL